MVEHYTLINFIDRLPWGLGEDVKLTGMMVLSKAMPADEGLHLHATGRPN